MEKNRGDRVGCFVLRRTASVVAALLSTMGGAQAIEIKTDNPDVEMSWGNTVRYNLGTRINKRNDVQANGVGFDEGDYAYDRGDVVTNRLDFLTEFDFSYQKKIGFRTSAAAWVDAAFNDTVRTNPALSGFGSYGGNQFSDPVKRYYKGPSGEILDAYVFANFSLGDMPGNIKLGRNATLWGEALVLSTHSVSYAQAPINIQKALTTPGVDAKEVALPIGQVSGALQVTPTVALAAQYIYEWKPSRLPEGGTYLSASDLSPYGPSRTFITAPTGAIVPFSLANGGVVEPNDKREWGVSARWSPEWLDGTMGFYYREFDERLPWVKVNVAPGGNYQFVYANRTKLAGLSLSKQLAGMSVGMELLRRENGALNSTITNGASEGARGDTWHGLLNAVTTFAPNQLWDSAALVVELAYSRWDKIRSQAAPFNECTLLGRDKSTGCSTKDNSVVFVRFAPSWTAVQPGWDVGASMALSYGLKGNSAVIGGGNQRTGSYSIGTTLTYNAQHDFTIAYNDYFAQIKQGPTSAAPVANNPTQQISDRGWLSFTYKTSF